MSRLLFVLATLIVVFMFSCDTTSPDFDDAVPGVFNLTTNVSPSDAGTVDPSGGEFVAGATIDIRAIPETGYMFERWEGDLVGTTNPRTLVMNRNRSVTAHFVEAEYPLNVEIIGEGTVREEIISQTFKESQAAESSVSIIESPDRDTLDDQEAQIEADNSDFFFDNPERDQLRPTMQGETETRETGQLNQQSVTTRETASVSQDEESFTILLTAEPDEGWRFDRWEGDLVGTQNPDTVVVMVDEQKNVTAVFTQEDAPTIQIAQNPSRTTAGEAISPAPTIQITDHNDNPVSGMNVEARLNINDFTSASTTVETTDVNGIARFENLIIEVTSGSYSISFVADDSDISSISSPEFEVVSAAAVASESEADVPNGVAGSDTEITITVRDRFGNRVNGAAGDLSVSVSGANSASPSVNAGDSSGEYIASYTPESSGEDEISIQLNGSPISGSPYTSEVTTSDISRSESSVTADPTELQAGSSSTVTVNLRDANRNAIGGLTDSDFDINVSGSGSAGSVSETSTGTYEFSVTNSIAQQVTVTVTAGGVTLDDTPEITFTGADSDLIAIPSGSQPGTSVAGQVIANSPAVRITDEFGNNIPGVDVTVTEQGGQEFASGTETVTTNNSGLAVFDDLVINEAGRYNLVFTSGSLTATSNAFDVNPAEANASETTAEVPNGAAGDKTVITITVRDEFGNRVEGVAGDLSVSISGANSAASADPISDEGNGVYRTGYTPILIGTDEITIELDGTGIQGSPFSSNVITSDADDVSIEQQPGQTVAGQSISGPPSVLVTDALGNPVEDVEVVVSLQGSASFDGGTTTRSTNNSGIASFPGLVIESTGSYRMVFNAIGVSDNAVSNSFNIVAASPDNLSRVSGNNQSGTVTSTLSDPFVVRVTDEFGNAVSGFNVGFQIDDTPSGASGQQMSSTSVSTDSDGNASSTLTLGDVAGTYTVIASAGAAGSTTFTASATAGSAETFNFGTISSPQTAGQSFSISITALDSQGNRATGYQGTASLSAASGSISPTSISFSNGSASRSVELNTAASNQSITAADGSISGTSNTFTVESGGVDAGNSSVSASPTSLEVGNSSTVTIELRDGAGNPVSGLANNINVSVSGDGSAGSVSESGSSGDYTVDVSNTTAQEVTVTVTADGTELDDKPTIDFTAADANSVDIESGDNQTGNVNEQLSDDLVVRVTDEFGNRVSGATVSFSVTGTPGGSDGSLSRTTHQSGGNGLASTRYTLGDTPGDYTITASVSGAGSAEFTATAETGSASQMNITTQPGNTTAGVAISPTPQVEVLDDADNPIEGVNVTVNLQGGSFDAGTTTRSTNSSGVAAFPGLIIETADSYRLEFDADAPGVSNVTSNQFNITAADADAVAIVSGNNQTASVNEELSDDFVVEVTDQFGNHIENETVDFEITGIPGGADGQSLSNESVQTNNSGRAATRLTLGDTPGTYEVTASAGGAGPVTFSAEAESGSASNMNITTQPGNTTAGTVIPASEVRVTDDSGNPIQGVNVAVSEQGGTNFDSGTTTQTTDGSGIAAFNNLMFETAGTYRLVFNAAASGVDNVTSEPFEVEAAEGDPNNTVANVPSGTAGDETTITITVEDAFENSVDGAAGSLSVEVSGANTASPSVQTTGTSGQYSAVYTPTNTGSDTITIELDGSSISGSPYTSEVSSSGAENIIVEQQPAQTIAGQAVAGPPSALVRDGQDNPVSGVQVTAELNTGSFAGGTTQVDSDNSGISEFDDLIINAAGMYSIEFSADGVSGTANTNSFEVVAADANDLSIMSGDNQTGPAGEELDDDFVVLVRDEFNNPVEGETVNFSISESPTGNGGSLSSGSGITDESGEASTRLTLGSETGTYEVEATVNGVGSVTFTAEAEAGEASIINVTSEPENTPADEPIRGSPAVEVTDLGGNGIIGIEVTVREFGGYNFDGGNTSRVTGTSGTAVFDNLLINRTGSYRLVFEAAGVGAAESEEFDISPGPVSSSSSSANATTPHSADGEDESTVTVDLRDEFDNEIEGVPPGNFDIDVGINASASLPSETTPGTYTFGVTNTTAETVIVTVTVNGTTLEDTPEIEFEDAGPSILSITQNTTDTQAGTAMSPAPTVSLIDGGGAAIPDVEITASLNKGSFSGSSTLTAETNSNGIATFSNLEIETADDGYAITFSAADPEIENITSNSFEIFAGPVSSTQSSVTASSPHDADGVDASDVIVQLRDEFSNVIADVSSEDFTIDVGANADAGAVSEPSPGTYEFGVTNTTAETVTVTVAVNGTTLDDAPEIEFEETGPSAMEIVTQPTDTRAGNVIDPAPQVRIFDNADNTYGGIAVTVSEESNQSFHEGTLEQFTDGSGVATFDNLIITAAGRYNLVFDADADGVPNVTSEAFNVNPGVGSPANTTADITDDGTAGEEYNIIITVRDEYGNRVEGAANDLYVNISGANSATPVITEAGDGDYTTSYMPENSGDDDIRIELFDVDIDGSIFQIEIFPSSAHLLEMEEQPGETTAGLPVAGPPSAVVTDLYNNPVPEVMVSVALQEGEFADGNVDLPTNENGFVEFPGLIIHAAANYTLVLSADEIEDNTTSNSFDVIPADANGLAIESGDNQTEEILSTLEPFVVEVTDDFGNPVPDITVNFVIDDEPADATGQVLSNTSVISNADGLAATTLTLGNKAGDYFVNADGGVAGTQFFTSTALAGTASDFTFVEIETQTAGEPFEITVRTVDSEDNLVISYNDSANLSASESTITPDEITFSDGIATLDVTLDEEGSGRTITADDGSISGTSNEFDVQGTD